MMFWPPRKTIKLPPATVWEGTTSEPSKYTLPPSPSPTLTPHGCICPPTSEQTCGNPLCPRKPSREGANE